MNTPLQSLALRLNAAIEAMNERKEALEVDLVNISNALEAADLDVTSEDVLFEKLDAGRLAQESLWLAEQSLTSLSALKEEITVDNGEVALYQDRFQALSEKSASQLPFELKYRRAA